MTQVHSEFNDVPSGCTSRILLEHQQSQVETGQCIIRHDAARIAEQVQHGEDLVPRILTLQTPYRALDLENAQTIPEYLLPRRLIPAVDQSGHSLKRYQVLVEALHQRIIILEQPIQKLYLRSLVIVLPLWVISGQELRADLRDILKSLHVGSMRAANHIYPRSQIELLVYPHATEEWPASKGFQRGGEAVEVFSKKNQPVYSSSQQLLLLFVEGENPGSGSVFLREAGESLQ